MKNDDLWRRIMDRDLSPEQIVEMDVKDLASEKMKQLRVTELGKEWET